MDVLHPLSDGLIRGIYVDGRYQFTESIRGELFNMNVLMCFLNEHFNILDLLFLYFNFLLDREDFLFQLLLLGIVALAHHVKTFMEKMRFTIAAASGSTSQSGNSSQGFLATAGNDDRFLDLDVVDGTADESGEGGIQEFASEFP